MTLSDVEQLEERPRLAMLAGNVAALDDLLPGRLRFVTLEGFIADKEADLEAHRSGRLRLTTLEPGGRHVELLGGEVALVNVSMQVAGRFAGAEFAGLFRYTRTWYCEDGRPRIIAGQVCAVQADPR